MYSVYSVKPKTRRYHYSNDNCQGSLIVQTNGFPVDPDNKFCIDYADLMVIGENGEWVSASEKFVPKELPLRSFAFAERHYVREMQRHEELWQKALDCLPDPILRDKSGQPYDGILAGRKSLLNLLQEASEEQLFAMVSTYFEKSIYGVRWVYYCDSRGYDKICVDIIMMEM